MAPRFRLPLIALALALPAPALAQSAQDFQLPPAPSPTASPRVQGPVDEEAGPVPVRPRVIPTAAPTPRATATQPAPSPTPTASATTTPPRTSTAQPRAAASPQPRTTAAVQPADDVLTPPIAPRETPPVEPPVATGVPAQSPVQSAPPPTATTSPASVDPAEDEDGILPWLLGLGLLAALGAGGYVLWRRRQDAAPPPVIMPPVVRAGGPPPGAPLSQALSLRAEAVKLTRSFAFATLDYRLTLINRTDHAMSDLAVGADLVSASGQAPMEQQVAMPGTALPVQHQLTRLAPGQTQQLKGQVRLPIGEAQVIRQGRLPLLVPLLRVRIEGSGDDELARTFVIGQGAADGSRLQPFRLDDGPRSYQPIAQRALD